MSSEPTFDVTEIKAFVPAKDFALSKQFYRDIGFTKATDGGGVAYFHIYHASFLLQDFCTEPLAENFMMHMLVEDVETWWNRMNEGGVVARYGVKLSNIELQPWRMRDFCITDPSGVLWRIGQNVKWPTPLGKTCEGRHRPWPTPQEPPSATKVRSRENR